MAIDTPDASGVDASNYTPPVYRCAPITARSTQTDSFSPILPRRRAR
jgi:hypothetical protein